MLHFDYETVVDGRKLARPVNYAMVRIVPPEGVTVDAKRRPYLIIDPRAGHGPGIGGFKDDSQVGVALREGHPVYFVIFFRDPEPGQTLLDVCEAEKSVREEGARAAPGEPQAGDRRQLPGRLGGDDARGRGPGRHRADRDQRRTDVLLGRRLPGRPWRQPDALRGRHAGRHLARVADLGLGRRHLRRCRPGAELREQQPREHVLGQVLPPVRERRHRAAALPRVRALVGWLLPDEPGRDRVDHAQSLRRQQALDRRHSRAGRQVLRPARHQGADHPVRVDGRRHHAAAAGVQLGGRRVRLHRGDQGARAGDRRTAAQEHRPPGHLRVRQGGEEGTRADRLGAEVGRDAAARPLWHGNRRAQESHGRRRIRGAVPRAPARGSAEAPQPARAAGREAVRSRGRALGVQPKRLRALRAAVRPGTGQRGHREALAAVPSAALPALGALRPQPVAGVARPCGADRQGAAAGDGCRQPRPEGREDGVGSDQRVARLLSGDPRRDQRGAVLPDVRQRVLPVPRRPARSRGPRRGNRGGAARPAVRQGSAGVDRARAGFPKRWPASVRCSPGGALRCRSRASRSSRSSPPSTAISCRTSSPTSGGASVASRTSSSATSPTRRSPRCPGSCRRQATASG